MTSNNIILHKVANRPLLLNSHNLWLYDPRWRFIVGPTKCHVPTPYTIHIS